MNIRETILPPGDTLLVTMTGEVGGDDFVRWRCELSERNDVSRLHIIYDLRGYTGSIDNDDLKAVATAIREPITDRWTVIVSCDEFMDAWIRVIEAIALAHPQAVPGRPFALRKTIDHAHRLLIGPRLAVTTSMDDAHKLSTTGDGYEV
jgi:hypothetical protein